MARSPRDSPVAVWEPCHGCSLFNKGAPLQPLCSQGRQPTLVMLEYVGLSSKLLTLPDSQLHQEAAKSIISGTLEI